MSLGITAKAFSATRRTYLEVYTLQQWLLQRIPKHTIIQRMWDQPRNLLR